MTSLRFCSCRKCKRGRDQKSNQRNIRRVKKSVRRIVKELLRTEKYESIQPRTTMPYTD